MKIKQKKFILSAIFQASIIVVIYSCTTRVNLPLTRNMRQLDYLRQKFVTELFLTDLNLILNGLCEQKKLFKGSHYGSH